jgi:hypothetical protein
MRLSLAVSQTVYWSGNGTVEAEADDGTRTHDTWLGKPVLYQLSYVRAP